MPIFGPDQIARYAQQAPAAPAPASAPSAQWPYWAAGLGNGADLATTLLALRRQNVQEANPLLPASPPLIAAIKALATVPELWAIHHEQATGHPTAAKVLGAVIGGMGGGLAAHNLTVGR